MRGDAVKWNYDRKDSYHLLLSFFLILGAVFGTVFCNMMDGQMKAELGSFTGSLVSAPALRRLEFSDLFYRVAAKRIPQLFCLFLMELTPISPVLFMGIAAYLGFSSALTVSVLTMQAGLTGIFRYLVLLFPHAFFYLPVLYALLWWMPGERKALRPAAAVVLTAAMILGAALEAFINPWAAAVFL